MEGKMIVTINEVLMMQMIEEKLKKSRISKNLKVIAYALVVPWMILTVIFIIKQLFAEKTISFLWRLSLSMLLFMIWFIFYGYKATYLYENKRKMKKIQFPIEQTVKFDEYTFSFRNNIITYNAPWEDIDIVCETERYWFLGIIVISADKIGGIMAAVEKRQLTSEQYEFILEKCKIIAAKKKRF